MDELARKSITAALRDALGAAKDVTPGEGQPLHVLLPSLVVPPPWQPSPLRALTRWGNWPQERPEFFVAESLTGSAGQPPQSSNPLLVLGATWLSFSFGFKLPWNGDDPVRAIQLWLGRFQEPN